MRCREPNNRDSLRARFEQSFIHCPGQTRQMVAMRTLFLADVFAQSYHWSFMQVACRTSVCHSCETGLISGSVIEYATDLAFRTPAILTPMISFPGKHQLPGFDRAGRQSR